jgi:hypothetical protein
VGIWALKLSSAPVAAENMKIIKSKIEQSILYYYIIKRSNELLYDEHLLGKFSCTSQVWYNIMWWG